MAPSLAPLPPSRVWKAVTLPLCSTPLCSTTAPPHRLRARRRRPLPPSQPLPDGGNIKFYDCGVKGDNSSMERAVFSILHASGLPVHRLCLSNLVGGSERV